jgi:hypothetical protein
VIPTWTGFRCTLVLVYGVDEGALLAVLNRNVGDHLLIAQGIYQQTNVHELLWKERIVGILENRLQFEVPVVLSIWLSSVTSSDAILLSCRVVGIH